MSRTTNMTYSLMARLSAASAVGGAMIALRFIGMNQFGYAFFGLMGGVVALLRPLAQMIPVTYMLVLLLVIFLMIYMALLVLVSLGILTLVSFDTAPKWLQPKWVFQISLLLACTLLLGLSLLHYFPGDQEQPVNTSPAHFIYPFWLLGVAGLLKRNLIEPLPSD